MLKKWNPQNPFKDCNCNRSISAYSWSPTHPLNVRPLFHSHYHSHAPFTCSPPLAYLIPPVSPYYSQFPGTSRLFFIQRSRPSPIHSLILAICISITFHKANYKSINSLSRHLCIRLRKEGPDQPGIPQTLRAPSLCSSKAFPFTYSILDGPRLACSQVLASSISALTRPAPKALASIFR
jgi:hypothetical protein